MRLIIIDIWPNARRNFSPLALGAPIWHLRSGLHTLGEKLVDAAKRATTISDVAYFTMDYLVAVARQDGSVVNSAESLSGDDLLLVNSRLRAGTLGKLAEGSHVILADDGEVLLAKLSRQDMPSAPFADLQSALEYCSGNLPRVQMENLRTWDYAWELVFANAEEIASDFALAGRSGVEGVIEEPRVIRGSIKDVFVAAGATVHPLAVIDASDGPVYIDERAQIHPFTRLEGPCYVGQGSLLLGAKYRHGCSVGPQCRIGGEVEESIIQGYSNKYHDGFLGHAMVGQYVNLGALTTNSDLRNDYGSVSMRLDERGYMDTCSMKAGCLIGDHVKTSIGTLFNTGSYVGAFGLVVAGPSLLPKYIPSFCSHLKGKVNEHFKPESLYAVAAKSMARRGQAWTAQLEQMWDHVYRATAAERAQAIAR